MKGFLKYKIITAQIFRFWNQKFSNEVKMFIKIRKSNFGFYCEIKKTDAHDALKKAYLLQISQYHVVKLLFSLLFLF